MKTAARGFTLIELVVVIVILAILAAIALPKFAGLQADARLAKVNGALASMKAAAAMAHAQLIARGFSATETISQAEMLEVPEERRIVIEGTTVGFVNGYPAAAQIAEISGITATDYYLPAAAAGSQVIAADSEHDGSGSSPACTVVYTEATTVGGHPAQPSYSIEASPVTCQ